MIFSRLLHLFLCNALSKNKEGIKFYSKVYHLVAILTLGIYSATLTANEITEEHNNTFLERSLDTTKLKEQGENPIQIATYYFDLARINKSLGDNANAAKNYQKAIAIVKKLGQDHIFTPTLYFYLGEYYEFIGDELHAMENYKKALASSEEEMGKGHLETVGFCFTLGRFYKSIGDYTQAEKFYLNMITIIENGLDKNNMEIIEWYTVIGSFYIDYGAYTKAAKYYQKALDIAENVLGVRAGVFGQPYRRTCGQLLEG